MTEDTAASFPTPPAGASFEFEVVRSAKGNEEFSDVPILVWGSSKEDVDAAIAYYTPDGISNILNGTSLRVSFQGIARRYRLAGKSNAEIAQAQIDFRPGHRSGTATPESKAAKAARRASETVENKGLVTDLLEKIASGELSEADLASLLS